ncbi:hypothetical protein PpBr36_00625 [Pyricularia pennisetigena]|uniref:hypothetical protein n=1 Tax=Pyricularia pennisetigena TaxID=1578925 RepID=UPI0011508C65|nr:hypothetical protein PpBr36_00625 [Pyricularia pennisetigena]TLS29737.1 hypothetical protein PpBr36_00625 [Pyricularia pennisetigena]
MVSRGLVLALLPLTYLTTAAPTGEHNALERRTPGPIKGMKDLDDDEYGRRGMGYGWPAAGPAPGRSQRGPFEEVGAFLDGVTRPAQSSPAMRSQGRRVDETVVYDDQGNPHYVQHNLPPPREAARRAALLRAETLPNPTRKPKKAASSSRRGFLGLFKGSKNQ